MAPCSEEYRRCVLCRRTWTHIWEHERGLNCVVWWSRSLQRAAHWECILCRRDRINSGNEGSGSGNETSRSDPGICHAFSQTLPCIGECPESGKEELVAGYRQQTKVRCRCQLGGLAKRVPIGPVLRPARNCLLQSCNALLALYVPTQTHGIN